MTLKERIYAEETKIGKFLLKFVAGIGLLATALGEGLMYIGIIPQDWISPSIRTTILISALIGGVIGKLTAKKS